MGSKWEYPAGVVLPPGTSMVRGSFVCSFVNYSKLYCVPNIGLGAGYQGKDNIN